MVSMSEPFYYIIIYLYYLIFSSPQARQGRGTSSGPFPR